ncbi:MAG: MMPL family transporter [Flavobacteriaceae bacterium]
MGKFFFGTYQLISKNRVWSAVGLLLILLGLIAVVSKIQFEEDITKLIPVQSENKDFEKVLRTVNFTDKVIVNIQRQPKGSVDNLTAFASRFLDSINSSAKDYIKNIQGKVADDEVLKTLDFVYDNLPLFLDASDYTAIRNKISKDSIAAITRENYKILISPAGIVAKKTIVKDPLGLSFITLKKLRQSGIADGFKLKDGFLLSEDEQHILLFLTTEYAANDTDKNEAFVKELYRLQNSLNTTFDHRVQVEYFGAALVAVANARQIKKDIQFTAGIAVIVLFIILIFFYKKLTLPLILFLPTLFGGLLSIAFLYLIRTKISAISLGIGSVLLGVTLDYALHILTHIRNNNSIKSLYRDVAPSILMSSLTTAAAFLCLLFLKSQALQDLGIFAAVSVLGASVFALLFIPQVYSTTDKKVRNKTFLDRLATHDFHKNKWGVAVVVILLITSVFTYNKVVFNKDIAKLNFEPSHLSEARERLDALTNINSKSMYLATYGTTAEKVLQANDRLYQKLLQLKKENKILGFSSVGALVHSEKVQQEKIALWENFWDDNTLRSLQRNLIESSGELGFKPSAFNQFYSLLNSKFKPLKNEDYKAINAFTIDDYIATEDGFTTITTLVKVDSAHTRILHDSFYNEDQTLLIDRKGMNEAFLGNLKTDFNRLVGYSVLVVLLILSLFFRSLSLTLVTSVPIFLTWFLTIGIMGLLHIEFNIFNIIISTFIFGLGVDYCIFITNGLLTEYRTGEKTLPTHKTSILLSVITTVLGVGVLIFAKHPALYTISVVSLIGILSAAFVAFTIQPLLFRLFIGSRNKRPITLRYFIHSVLSFGYFGLGGLLLSLYATIVLKLFPKSQREVHLGFHKMVSLLMKSVLYSNRFVQKKVINEGKETFEKPVIIIANHTSFLDILAIGMLHPKIIYLVNDWVYNSPIFGSAAKLAGAFPVSGGVQNSEAYLKKKISQGFSLIAFPEGTRSETNKIRRFHKGAFYLAEELGLDILPVLIHGNSEVLPKGSFIIKDGSITLKILDRISSKDIGYGSDSRERTKKIGAHFRKKFQKFRNEIEHETYFHPLVLEDFRYKGNAIYAAVREDLKENKTTYKTLLDLIDKKAKIIHLSKDYGQLDFLLALDSTDRKIMSFMTNETASGIFKNSYITHKYPKLEAINTLEKVLKQTAEVLIINLDAIDLRQLENKIKNEIIILILLKAGRDLNIENMDTYGFTNQLQNDRFIILKKGSNEGTL